MKPVAAMQIAVHRSAQLPGRLGRMAFADYQSEIYLQGLFKPSF
jgi:hypothetical protein